MSGYTKGPWALNRMGGFDDLHKLQGTTPEPHEGYFRGNDGAWMVSREEGRVAQVDFCGKAKRGMGYCAPDPEGMANAHLISAAPEMYEDGTERVRADGWLIQELENFKLYQGGMTLETCDAYISSLIANIRAHQIGTQAILAKAEGKE